MTDLLKTELFGGFTVLQVGVAVLGLVVLIWVIKALTDKKPEPLHMVEVTCECGWHGRVGKYNRVCRKCGKPL